LLRLRRLFFMISTHEPPFQALTLMDQSRLGRSTREIPYALGRIMDAAA
jgi:hypothetical protein